MAVSYNPAQQAAANAGASAAAIKKLATPKKKTPVVSPAPVAQNVAQAAATAAGASQGVANSLVAAPTVPNIAVPKVPVVTAPVNQALEDDQNLVFQRGYPSSTAPTSQPSLSALETNAAPSSVSGNPDLTDRGYPSTTEGYNPDFTSMNPAQLAAMNAGASQDVIRQLAGQSSEQIKSLEGDSDALKGLRDYVDGTQPTATPTPTGGSTGYSGSASTSNYMPNVTLPTAPGTGATSVTGEGTAAGGATGSVVAPTAPAIDMSNIYLEQLNNMAFEYDPASDKDYLRAVAQTENAIIQSMVGRGGLYSSVAQSAVSVKLADLAIDYENMAYDKYVDERNFMFERAQFEQQRLAEAWSQNFQVAQFDATLQQRKFENEMAVAEFQFALEKEAYNRKRQAAADARAAASAAFSREQAILKQQQQDKQNAIANALMENQLDVQKFNEMQNQWAQDGKASAEVAEYFADYGVYQGASINNSAMQTVIQQKERYLNNQAYEISEIAVDLGQAAIAVEYMDYYNQPAEIVIRGTNEANSSVEMQRNYMIALNEITDINTKQGYSDAIYDLTSPNSYGTNIEALGEYYYTNLLNELQQRKDTLGSIG